MAYGLEARAPLISHEIVEFGAKIPISWSINTGGKMFLKKTIAELPKEVIRGKRYFLSPATKWLQGDFKKEIADKYLNKKAITKTKLFNKKLISDLQKQSKGIYRLIKFGQL